jgi:hypothetical protein
LQHKRQTEKTNYFQKAICSVLLPFPGSLITSRQLNLLHVNPFFGQTVSSYFGRLLSYLAMATEYISHFLNEIVANVTQQVSTSGHDNFLLAVGLGGICEIEPKI